MALAILSEQSQNLVKDSVGKHNNRKAWMMTDFKELFLADSAITPAHLLAVGLKGVTNAGLAFGGYILSVCPEIDVKTLNASFLGRNYHNIKVSSDLGAMVSELKRVADVAKTEADNEANTSALNGTTTVLTMENLVDVLEKVRNVPMVESTAATEAFLKAQEIFESVKTQYLGVTEKESINA
jgi:hypothetical protein